MTPSQRTRIESMIEWHTRKADEHARAGRQRAAKHHTAKATSLRAALLELDAYAARDRRRALSPETTLS